MAAQVSEEKLSRTGRALLPAYAKRKVRHKRHAGARAVCFGGKVEMVGKFNIF